MWACESLLCVAQLSPGAPRDRCECLSHASVSGGGYEWRVCVMQRSPRDRCECASCRSEGQHVSNSSFQRDWTLSLETCCVTQSCAPFSALSLSVGLTSGDFWLENHLPLTPPQLPHLNTRKATSARMKATPVVLSDSKCLLNIKNPQI